MNWKQVCDLMQYSKLDSESSFQESLRDLLIKTGLGWEGENIQEQASYTIGSSKRIIPDIIITRDGYTQFVIEIKHPSHKQQQKDIEQLLSYMKLLEVNVGIYIGEFIEVFYKKIGEGSELQSVFKTTFSQSDNSGDIFLSLFNANSYSQSGVENFYKEIQDRKVSENKIKNEIALLITTDGSQLVSKLLQDYYISLGFSEKETNEILDKLIIRISSKNKKEIEFKDMSLKIPANPIPEKKVLRKRGVGEFAYEVIDKILLANKDLPYKNLLNLFYKIESGRILKNHIGTKEDVENSRERSWFIDRPHTSSDGIEFYISKEWGKQRSSKWKFDNLIGLARIYGIDIDSIQDQYFK